MARGAWGYSPWGPEELDRAEPVSNTAQKERNSSGGDHLSPELRNPSPAHSLIFISSSALEPCCETPHQTPQAGTHSFAGMSCCVPLYLAKQEHSLSFTQNSVSEIQLGASAQKLHFQPQR